MRRGVRSAVLGSFLALVLGLASLAGAADLPPGFTQDVIASGLTDPTAISFFPDGRIAIAQKSGIVRLVKNGALLPLPLIDLSDRVNDYWDRGLLGIAVDPDFAANSHVYLLYVFENNAADFTGTKTARLTRVTVTGDTADPASEVVILGTTTLLAQPGDSCKDHAAGADCLPADGPSHSVGNVKFASDGTLFLTLGDSSSFYTVDPDALRTQDLDSLAGKVMRITRTGQGLPTNPFWTGDASANRSKVWAYGVRNAYRFGLRPGSDVPYVGDVGWNDYEEIHVAQAGANLGWPCYEGTPQQAGYASYATCQALYAGSAPAGALTPLGIPFARIPASQGLGGAVGVIRDGDKPPVGNGQSARQYDSFAWSTVASQDWVGYTFPTTHTFDRVVFQEGMHFWDGGWFASLAVQVRQNGQWVNVSGLAIAPAYAGNDGVSYETYTLTFTPTEGDGIRLFGVPGGASTFISVGELEVFGTAGGGGGQPGETAVTAQAQSIIARIPASQGLGGALGVIRDGDKPPVGNGETARQYDSFAWSTVASQDWVGYTFATTHTFSRVVFQEGMHFWDGGWFASLAVQVRQNGQWVNVSGLVIAPAYAGNDGVSYEAYTLTFTPTEGDGIRLFGVPGGASTFISVGELEVYAQTTEPPPPTEPSAVAPALVEWYHNYVSSSVTAGVFYTGTSYPAVYQGAYFYGDFSRGWIRTLKVDGADALVPGSLADFAEDTDGPVDIEMGPDGLLYYVAISANEVRRIRYTAGNTPPVAVASGTPTSGLAPLTVQFSSTGSNDPDGDPITFEWDFGDGNVGTGPAPQHTYQLPNGPRVATLTVRDNHDGVGTATVTISVGNQAPTATIAAPLASLKYKVGDVIAYSGSATDPEQGALPASALSWQIVIHHCPGGSCHAHPIISGSGASGSFTVENHGDDSYYEIILTATDAGGLTNTVSRTIQPQTVQMTVTTFPAGLQVLYDGTQGPGPMTKTTIVGSTHTLNTLSPQGTRTFVSWSDGGAMQHTMVVGASGGTYTANFSCAVGEYRAEYFANRTLTGTPLFTRCETAINYNWGTGGPGNGIPNDNFSVRWTGKFTFTAGSRTFTTVSDDGVRLWVDNVLVINRWTDHGPTTDRATRTMTAGTHDIKVEYYERGGGAVIQVSW